MKAFERYLVWNKTALDKKSNVEVRHLLDIPLLLALHQLLARKLYEKNDFELLHSDAF